MKTGIVILSFGMAALLASCAKNPPATAEAPVNETASDVVMKKMITARVFVKPDKVTDFVEAAKAMIDSSNMEPGCESYRLYQDPYDNTNLIFVEVWQDQEAIDAHFEMTYFKAFGPKTSEWLLQPTELKIYDVSLQE